MPHEKKIQEYVKIIEHLKKQNADNPIFNAEIKKLEQKLLKLKEDIYSKLTPWQRILICRHPSRPHSVDLIKLMCDVFSELSGDRLFKNDPSVIGGFACIGELKCVLIGQEKGFDTESRVYRNFGMMHPEGYRKAFRLMKLAEKFNLPVVTLIDTPGAYPGLGAEERGQGWAIAENLRMMAGLKTPIISVIIGEGCSGGALGIGMADVVAMCEHAYYSVISPEGCASILWKDASKNIEAAKSLKLNAEDLQKMKIIDLIIKEPLGGAHLDPQLTAENIKQAIDDQWNILRHIPLEILLEQRYLKYRQMGQYKECATS